MPEPKMTPDQPIEILQERYGKLHTKKIQAETQHQEAQRQLDELKTQARAKYGTDDLTALQQKLDDMVAENARMKAQYQAELDKIETDLATVERTFADAAATGSGTAGGSRP